MKTESGKDRMVALVGKGVSPGLAKGKAFVYIDVLQRDSELYVIDRAQIGEEKARIEKAIDDVRQGLNIDAKQIEGKLGKQSGDIFLAQEAILRLIELVVRESGDTPVSLCGELAGRIDVIPRLLRTGVRSLSVAAVSLREATYTYGNIQHPKAFTINIPSTAFVKEADYAGIYSGKQENKYRYEQR
jgi:phosphoenolpyruvate-protein kinase (PTS system EI component)